MIGKFVIVRTERAGVHCGYLVETSSDGTCVRLRESRNVWRWRGANSLRELSLHGADMDQYTRITESIDNHIIPRVIEIIECTAKAEANLKVSRWMN